MLGAMKRSRPPSVNARIGAPKTGAQETDAPKTSAPLSSAPRSSASRRGGLASGFGAAPCHWGELVQGRLGPGGPLALVTLPCPALRAEAWFEPGGRHLRAEEPLFARAAAAALAQLGRSGQGGGRVTVKAAAPPGGGAGWSTATILAVIRAVAAACAATMTPEVESRIALSVEGAVDPLAFPADAPRLWAPREARTLAALAPPPPMRIAGAFDGPGVATDPADLDFPDMAAAFTQLREAFAAGDAALAATAATRSAEANLRRNPKPRWSAVQAIARQTGALGVAAAHTGSAVALLFAPDDQAAAWRACDALAAAGLSQARAFDLVGPASSDRDQAIGERSCWEL